MEARSIEGRQNTLVHNTHVISTRRKQPKLLLHLGRTDQHACYHMRTREGEGENIELQSTELAKDLGIYVDPSLSFTSHCEIQVGKANKTLGLILRSYTYLDKTNLTKLYIPQVRCTLEYRYPAWSPHIDLQEGL